MAQGNVFVKVVFAGYCWSKLLALLLHIANDTHWSSQGKTSKSWPQLAMISMSWLYALCSTEEALSGKIKKWQKITWLIAEVTRHSWSCSYLYAAKLYSFDLYHTWICSSFLYHTKIYLLHNFLKHFASFCLQEKVLLHKICHLNLIKRNISNIKQHSISHHKWDGVETEKMTGICQECAGVDAIRIKFGKTTLLREGTKNPFDYPIWMSIGTT